MGSVEQIVATVYLILGELWSTVQLRGGQISSTSRLLQRTDRVRETYRDLSAVTYRDTDPREHVYT